MEKAEGGKAMRHRITHPQPTDEFVVLPAYEAPSQCMKDYPEQTPATPSEWLAHHFQDAATKYGSPIMELRRLFPDSDIQIVPLAVNEDALAAILGSLQCGSSVFHIEEQQFYSKQADGFYEPVDLESLKMALSQLFIKCATDMPSAVDIRPLFNEFRTDVVLDRILKRAKAILAVDDRFFDPVGPNARNPIKVPKEAVRSFVDQNMVADEASVLTLRDTFETYQAFCKENDFVAVPLNQFKACISPHILRRFNRGIRGDLNMLGASKSLGWKGIALNQSKRASGQNC
jgi:hypothetical protein